MSCGMFVTEHLKILELTEQELYLSLNACSVTISFFF
jgi:hypothetical protein